MRRAASRIWGFLEDHPWLTMIVAVAAQTWGTLNNRALWFSDEVRYANAYQNLVERGHWLVLSLNGQHYPDKPPVYFWFLWLLDVLTPADMPAVFFLGAAVSGLFFVMTAYVLARWLGFDRTVSLAAVLVLLSTFLLCGLFHYSRMDLLFAGLIILSHACFYRAFTEDRQGKWPLWAFLLGGVATLVKGPLGFIFPLLTAVLFLLWRGEAKKLFTGSMALGLVAMVGLLAAWVGGVVLAAGPTFLMDTVLGKHVLQRATHTFHHREPFYYYLIAFPLAWLPWTLFAFAAPVWKTLSLRRWGARWAERREAGPCAFLWIMFGATFVFLSSLSGKVLIYILPMFPPLAILMADAMPRQSQRASRKFWTLVAGVWTVLGAGLILAGDLLPFPVPLRGLGVSAVLLIAGGWLVHSNRGSGFKAPLLCAALAMIIWLQPVGLLVAPSLDDAMSPKRQAQLIGQYADQGHRPLAFKIYSGIFTYYAGRDLAETGDWEKLAAMTAEPTPFVLSIRERHWNEWRDKPDGLKVVHRQDIAGMIYLVVVKE